MTSKRLCLYVFTNLLCFSCISSLDIGNLGKYEFVLSPREYNTDLELSTMSHNVKELPHNNKKPRIRRQLVNAAPVLQGSEQQFEEHVVNKVTGSSVTMKCEPKGSPTPNITWYKNDVTPVQRSDHGGVLPVTYDVWSLLLNDLVVEDNGKYTCLVCNPFGCAKHVHELKIIRLQVVESMTLFQAVINIDSPCIKCKDIYLEINDFLAGYPRVFPHIQKGYPGNKTVQIYYSAEMSCPTVNNTDYSVKWKKLLLDSRSRPIGSRDVVNMKGKYSVVDDTLLISYAERKDEGWYMCITNNTMGSDNATGYLKITDFSRSLQSNGSATNLPVKNSGISRWLTPILSTLLVVSLLIVVIVFLKFKKERLMKQRAVDTAREVMFEQWMKVVSVETENGYSPMGTLQMPKVKIEKKRLSDIIDRLPNYVHSAESEYVLAVDAKWELDRKYLTLGDVLGEGEFGRVVRAAYSGTSKTDVPSVVAVKMLKEVHSDADMISFVSEVEIMKMIGKHKNIINLVGCCTYDGPFYAVVEFASNGSLRDFLKKRKPRSKKGEDFTEEELLLKQTDLVEFTLQVARGMEYLASRGCIHRDLAARNVLVSADMVLKIADFGLARDVRDSDYYRKRTAGKLPVRWMAPESLCHNYYTTQSDVWSFGVLAWEIMTFGRTPYPDVSVYSLYQYLKSGKRMARPDDCREDMYAIMTHCWTFRPDDRPRFAELVEVLQQMLEQY